MRSTTRLPCVIIRYTDKGEINYLNVNGKWSNTLNPGFTANQTRHWLNPGNAWHAVNKLVIKKKENFDRLFVVRQNKLVQLPIRNALSMDHIIKKSEQIHLINTFIKFSNV
jgi:hypothetical protein